MVWRYREFPTAFPTRISRKISHKNFPQDFPTRISSMIFPQEFQARFSHKIFPQDFPKLDPDWLAPHLPILNAKFPPITAFLKFSSSPSPCPARFSHKNFLQEFPQEFPTRFSRKNFLSWILIGWLSITLFQMLNFHQSLSCEIGLLIIKGPRYPHHPSPNLMGTPNQWIS